MSIDLDLLRRAPDVEGPGLVAVDAADRLILDESRAARAAVPAGSVVVIGDAYGALTLGALADDRAGGDTVRCHQDLLTGERALAANAERFGLSGRVRSHATLDDELLRGARVVLLRLPRSLDALRDIAGLVAAHAAPEVIVFAGGRLKHMTLAMNDVLGTFFGRIDVTHARQKSRVLVAREPREGHEPVPAAASVDGLEIRAFGGVFGGARLDIGTRLLLAHLPADPPGGTENDPFLDLACGNGVIGAWLALRHPEAVVVSSDPSAVAVASAAATVAANGLAERMRVVRDDALSARPDGSASFVTLNPPFHSGAAVTDHLARHLFVEVARVLRPGRDGQPGGELWCVWNSPLRYRPLLERLIGPTRQVARDAKFTVTVSTRR